MANNISSVISKKVRIWKSRHLIASLGWAIGIACGVCSILYFSMLSIPLKYMALAGWFAGLIAFWIYTMITNWRKISDRDLIHQMHQDYPAVEYSMDLAYQDYSRLPAIAQKQLSKIQPAFARIKDQIRVAQPIPRGALVFSLGIAMLFLAAVFHSGNSGILPADAPVFKAQHIPGSISTSEKALAIQTYELRVIPPDYTGISPYTPDSISFLVPYGSLAEWRIRTDQAIKDGILWINDRQQISAEILDSNRIRFRHRLYEKSIYRMVIHADSVNYESDYAEINIIPDLAPRVEIMEAENYTIVEDQYVRLEVHTICSDDYGITQARIVTTLSRGDGEGVVFKNDTLVLDPLPPGNMEYSFNYAMKLDSLGMIPGDELYFHFEASDNRQPTQQISRTAKYIVAIADTGRVITGIDGRLGVNRMPEYFRSQRQIIIDTEKLIARESSISRKELMGESNNIAIDQKLLRLRYGQFLGEEYETTIGQDIDDAVAAARGALHTDHDHEGHHHDEEESGKTESEESYLQDHQHETIPEEGFGNTLEDISEEELETMLEPYAHFHDRSEQAGYFDQLTVAKLKAALGEMWSAEFHLRMGEPRKALPFEYRALKMIKEIQQASRIYVERIGFEPPEINIHEQRLTGDLEEIRPRSGIQRNTPQDLMKNLMQSVAICEDYLQGRINSINNEQERVLNRAGEFISSLALTRPGYIQTLQLLRDFMTGNIPPDQEKAMVSRLQNGFHKLLEEENKLQSVIPGVDSDLTKTFISQLRKESWQ